MKVKTLYCVVVMIATLVLAPTLTPAQEKDAAGTAQSSTPPSSQPDVTIASDSLHGAKVYGTDGKELGSISKLLIDPKDGRVTSVMIKHGGAAGVGTKEVAVPWDALKVQRGDRNRLVISMQRDVLERAQPAASPASDRDASQPKRQR
jgi:sporulation protein YlmC with PRC-barrel domain